MGSLPAAQQPIAGRIADRYEVVRTLGTGGMAVVYEVLDTVGQERLALKQLSLAAEQAMPRARTLFQREYHALSQLAHPCIVAVRDYGLDAKGPYYTMELLDGQDLRARAPLPWLDTCRLMRDVASCLGMLHARGLLHRDVHYRNVRCTSDGRARLLDFGTLSTFGVATDVAGMSPFVAPEALRGQPLDARCDLYSLGCLMYWVLVGEHAFPAYRHDELEPLWARGTPRLAERVPDAPPALDALLASMMAMDPMARPSSAAEVIHRLGALAGLPESEPIEVGRSYLQSPRLVGRQRELERFRLSVTQHLRARPSAPPAPTFSADNDIGATGRFRPVGKSSRSTGSVRGPARPASDQPLLVIEGPGGSGRSRMLQELMLEARLSGALVLHASAAALRAQEYGVVNAVLIQLRKLRPDLEASLPKDELALLLDAEDRKGLGLMSRGTGAAFRDDRAVRKQRVMRELLLEAARNQGLLLAIDDFELCDVASAALLTSLLEGAPGKRVLIGVALQSGAPREAGMAIDWLCAHGRVLPLAPLDEAEVEALLRSLFGSPPHLKLLASFITQTSAGSPLACMELVRHLVDTRVIRYEHGAWLLPPRPATHGLPQSLRDALGALVEALPPAARALAETFCMFDAPLPLERCVELSGMGEGTAFDALSELVARNVLVGDGLRYRLVHRELREVLLLEMAPDKRRALHLRVGHWLLAQQKRPLEAAWHLMEGGAEVEGAALLVRTSRTNPTSVVGAALRSGEAGTRILRRAVDVCERTPLSPADRVHFAVSCMTVETFLERGDLSRASALIEQLKRDAGLEGWPERSPEIEPRPWIGAAFRAAVARHTALPEHERGLSPLEAMNVLPLCALHLSRVYVARADRPALAEIQRLVEPYAHVPQPMAGRVVQHVDALVAYVAGELASARAGMRVVIDALEALERAGGPIPVTGAWRLDLALTLAMAWTPDSDATFEIVETIERLGPDTTALECTVARMLRHLFRGEQDVADELAERMESLLVQRPGGGFLQRAAVMGYAAAAYARLGDAQGLQQVVAQLERLSERQPGHLPTLELMRAALLRLRGEWGEAERGYLRVLSEHGAFARIGVALEAIPGLVQVLLAQERFAEALELAAHQLEGDGPVPQAERSRVRHALLPDLALCMAREGRAAQAAAELDAELERAHGEPLHRFRLHAARAAVALELGEPEAMQQHLRRAGKHARAAGSSALVARHEAFAERLGRRKRVLEQPPS